MKQKAKILIAITSLVILITIAAYIYLATPRKIRVTNLTDTSVTVTWETAVPTKTEITTTQKPEELPFYLCLSARKKAGAEYVSKEELVSGRNHSVTLINLDPETNYYFAVGGGAGDLIRSKGEKRFAEDGYTLSSNNSFQTHSVSDTPIVPATLYGKIELPGKADTDDRLSKCYEQTVVFINGGSVSPVSTLVNETGGWTIDLSASRDVDGVAKQYSGTISGVSFFVDAGSCGEAVVEMDSVGVNENVGNIVLE